MDVFISYSSKNKDWVRGELLKGIEDAGLHAFIDYRDFTRGASSIREMERGVVEARKTLLVLTPDYVQSEYAEIESIMVQTLSPANRDLRMIPLLRRNCEKPLRIAALTHIDFTEGADLDLAWRQLLTALGPTADAGIEREDTRRAYESGRPDEVVVSRKPRWSRFSSAVALSSAAAVVVIGGLYWFGRNRTFPQIVGGVTGTSAAGPRSVNSPAYDLYLRGKVNVRIENRINNNTAIQQLRQAIALDPNLAVAYAELARAYSIKARYLADETEKLQLNEDAEVAVERALTLDPNLPEGHYSRGLILWTHGKRFPHEQVIKAYLRAIELKPRFDEAHHQLGFVYLHVGLLDEAWGELETALAINPANTSARYRFGVIQMCRGQYEDALRIFKSTPQENNPTLWTSQTSMALFRLGRVDEANEMIAGFLSRNPQDEGGAVSSVKAMILAKAGEERQAEDAIQQAIAAGRDYGHFHHTAYNIASAYALLNRPDQALKWLEVTAEDGFPVTPYSPTTPSWIPCERTRGSRPCWRRWRSKGSVISRSSTRRKPREVQGSVAQFVEVESKNHVLLAHEPAWTRFQEAVLEFTGAARGHSGAARVQGDEVFDALSPREREVLGLLSEGLDNAQIAVRLEISEKTVRNHVSSVYDKLGVWSRAQPSFSQGSAASAGKRYLTGTYAGSYS